MLSKKLTFPLLWQPHARDAQTPCLRTWCWTLSSLLRNRLGMTSRTSFSFFWSTASLDIQFDVVKEFTTFVTIVPCLLILFVVVDMTDTVLLVLKLAISTTTDRKIACVATHPLIAAPRFHERHRFPATKLAMFSRDWRCLPSVVCHNTLTRPTFVLPQGSGLTPHISSQKRALTTGNTPNCSNKPIGESTSVEITARGFGLLHVFVR